MKKNIAKSITGIILLALLSVTLLMPVTANAAEKTTFKKWEEGKRISVGIKGGYYTITVPSSGVLTFYPTQSVSCRFEIAKTKTDLLWAAGECYDLTDLWTKILSESMVVDKGTYYVFVGSDNGPGGSETFKCKYNIYSGKK